MYRHPLPACVKHEFQRMTASILCIQFFFVKCFNVNLQNIKRGILQALWKNLVHSQTFWKVHARSQSKFTKVRFKKIYCFKSDFYKSVIHQAIESNFRRKCLWEKCACKLFLSMNSKTLLFTFKLLVLSVVFDCCKCKQTAPKAERQTTKFSSCHLSFAYTRQFT